MFGFIADILTTVSSVLFPIFASYKALKTSDPAQLAPWLMYWAVLSGILLIESMFAFILTWIPFYSWIRFFIHFYLVMPGSQGALQLYRDHLEPFLAYHEEEIEIFISNAHEKARAAGLQYLRQAIEWVKVNMLNMAPTPRTPPHSRNNSLTYAQQLLGRFNLPNARPSAGVGPAGDIYNLVSQALSGASTLYPGSREEQAEELSRSRTLIPADIVDDEQRMTYVSTQRERLRVLLQAFDREAYHLASEPGLDRRADLSKSRSEVDFDKIDRDEVSGGSSGGRTPGEGQPGWMPWPWSKQSSPPSRPDLRRDRSSRGKTSGADPDLAY